MIIALLAAAAATASPLASPTATPSPTPAPTPVPRPAAVAVIWHLAPAPYLDKTVRTAYVALAAPDAIAPQLHALHAHPRARFSMALDADALDGLAHAAVGGGVLEEMAAGHLSGDVRVDDLLRVLSQVPSMSAGLANTPAARRYHALAAAAPLALAGQRAARFSNADLVDFAGFAAIVRLADAGALSQTSPLLEKSSLTSAEASAALSQLAALDAGILDGLKTAAASGQLELLADPAGEPILPLLIDGGGKSGAFVVLVEAVADAAYQVDTAMHLVNPGGGAVGVYSPHGAYDDKTAALLEQHHAAFGLFSDRVLRSSPIGGSKEAVAAADAAAFHAYSLEAAEGKPLMTLFWHQDDGASLSVLSTRLPATAMGARTLEYAKDAGARGGDGSILIVRIEADGLWNRRPDRQQVVDELAAALASGATESATIAQYVREHPPSTQAYGFAPAADEGGLSYWMGTINQVSMWRALATARAAAGGNGALVRETSRRPLLEAEASHWFLVPQLLAPGWEIQHGLDGFRLLIADIYRAAGRPVPQNIAPMRAEPAPTPSPKP